MSRRLIGGQKPFTVLVAHFTGQTDSRGNPVKSRSAMTMQHFPEVARANGVESLPHQGRTPGLRTRVGHASFTTDGVPVSATGTITVTDTALVHPTRVHLGSFVLTAGEDFALTGTTTDVALALSNAIDNLPGYSGTPVANVITVSGPTGPIGNEALFKATGSSAYLLTFSPTNGALSGAEPAIGPITSVS